MPCWFILILYSTIGISAPSLKIQGSTTVNPVVSDAAEYFRTKGWKITVDTQGGSSGGISALGEGLANIAMSSRELTEKDKQKFPKTSFTPTLIGYDGVALAISRPIYESGVKALTIQQIKDIYESKIDNWKNVGGRDAHIVFYNKEPGRGTWEVFANFLYGASENAPSVHHPEVGGNEEGRTKVSSHPSAMTQLSASWVEQSDHLKVLGIKLGDEIVLPTADNIYSGKYPMTRRLLVVTNGAPEGPEKEFINYLATKEGQSLIQKHGYLPLKRS